VSVVKEAWSISNFGQWLIPDEARKVCEGRHIVIDRGSIEDRSN